MRFYKLFLLMLILGCSENEVGKTTKNLEKGVFLDDWTYDVFTDEGTNTTYRMWIPENVIPKAILVITPGNNSSGLSKVNLPDWRTFAKNEEIALVGAYVTSSIEKNNNHLLLAINKIGEKHNLDFLSDLPFLLRGHSSGGRFSYEFSAAYPEKTIAYANIKGPVNSYSSKMPAGLLIMGDLDSGFINTSLLKAFKELRKSNNIVCLARERLGEHGVGFADNLVRTFFSTALKKRLNTSTELLNINITDIYLGNNIEKTAFKYKDYNFNLEEASCLLDEDFKNAWLSFVRK